MIDANDIINNIRSQLYKKGYKVDEKEEIKIVHDTLVRSGMPIQNFLMKLQNLTLLKEETKDFGVAGYNPKSNTITYLNDEDLIHELLHVAATENDSKSTGITIYEDGIQEDEEDFVKSNYGLDEGITDMFAEMANSNVPCGYPFEKLCAETLRQIFGLQIFTGHFKNSYDKFIAGFPEEVQVDVVDLIYNLDEYSDLTKSIYSGDAFPEDVSTLEEITESIVKSLATIAETVGKDRNEIIGFLNEKVNDPKIQSIRELIKLDNAVESLSTRNL